MKIKSNYFDTHKYKIVIGKNGKYHVYLKHKLLPFGWKHLNDIVKKIPIMNKDREQLESKWMSDTGSGFNMEAHLERKEGYESYEYANKALNCFVHVIMHVNAKQDFIETGDMKMYAVTENI